jgi:predicted component of type VI protein secretion system
MLSITMTGERMRNGIVYKYKTYGVQQNIKIPLKMSIWGGTGKDGERDKCEE